MMQAKRLYGAEKTATTRASFERKIEEMSRVLSCWQKNGVRDQQFWPTSLAMLAAWEDDQKGIFRWKSNNVTKRDGVFSDLVNRYWNLQKKADTYLKKTARTNPDSALKHFNSVLIHQNTALIWNVMELRDALSRVDPENEALSRLPFP